MRKNPEFTIVGGRIDPDDFPNWEKTLLENGFNQEEVDFVLKRGINANTIEELERQGNDPLAELIKKFLGI